MSTAALIPVEEYLATSYRPDCDYVDGEVQERLWGEREHSIAHGEVMGWFAKHESAWGVRTLPSIRMKISSSRYRVADVAIFHTHQKLERFPAQPPLLIVEILSPEDTLARMRSRVRDYIAMGVGHIWLLDPLDREAFRCTANGFEKAAELRIAGTSIHLPLPEIFAALD